MPLDPAAIARDDGFGNIGELWLKGDHYKWRAMRLCGVPECKITGRRTIKRSLLRSRKSCRVSSATRLPLGAPRTQRDFRNNRTA
ncbi:MAG: glucuronate isomerase [Christensenellales bacterium]